MLCRVGGCFWGQLFCWFRIVFVVPLGPSAHRQQVAAATHCLLVVWLLRAAFLMDAEIMG